MEKKMKRSPGDLWPSRPDGVEGKLAHARRRFVVQRRDRAEQAFQKRLGDGF